MKNSFYYNFISGDPITAFFHMQLQHNSWRTLRSWKRVRRSFRRVWIGAENVSTWCPEGRLNIKMSSYQYSDPMLSIRRSRNRLIFSMEIPVHGRDALYIEMGRWIFHIFGTWITLNKISSDHERPCEKLFSYDGILSNNLIWVNH